MLSLSDPFLVVGATVTVTARQVHLARQALFYTAIFPFIAFFGAFGFVLYPMSNYFHPTALAGKLLAALGPSFLGPVAILRIWSFCLFYVMAELWGSVVVLVLFWGFANQVCLPVVCLHPYVLFNCSYIFAFDCPCMRRIFE